MIVSDASRTRTTVTNKQVKMLTKTCRQPQKWRHRYKNKPNVNKFAKCKKIDPNVKATQMGRAYVGKPTCFR